MTDEADQLPRTSGGGGGGRYVKTVTKIDNFRTRPPNNNCRPR